MNYQSNYTIKVNEIIMFMILLSIVSIIREETVWISVYELVYTSILIIFLYLIVNISYVKKISFGKNTIQIKTLLNTSEISYNEIEIQIRKYSLKPDMEKVILKSGNKRFIIKKTKWPEYSELVKNLNIISGTVYE
jgi:hypothetical protein